MRSDHLEVLYARLRDQLRGTPCDHTLAHTLCWAEAEGYPAERLAAGLGRLGAHCDCRMVMALRILAPDLGVPYAVGF